MDKAKKKRIQKSISWGCIALVILVLAVMPLLASKHEEASGPQASILSGTVGSGSISVSLHGGGTLEDGDSENVILPTGVKITEFLVKNGDIVTEGTPLAAVDPVSVMNAITQVQETMEYLQSEMEEVQNETVSSTVSAKAGGRVKAIYAQAGDDVQQVMLENGALALLSLDGLMAVKLDNSNLVTGEAVLLTLSDGTQVTGRVESCINGEAVITVEDKGYAIGEPVTITTGDGSQIGSGELYIHNAWKATAFTGTVRTVRAKEETNVSSGAALFTLTDTEYTAQLDFLASQHREYEKLMQELCRMYQEGVITAPRDGMISGVEEDSAFLLSGEESQWEAVPLASGETGWTIVLLSNQEPSTPPVTPTTYTGYAGIVTGVGIDGLILSMNQTGYAVSYTAEGEWDLSLVNLDTDLMLPMDRPFTTLETDEYSVGDIVVLIFDDADNFLDIVIAKNAEQPSIPPEPSKPTDEQPSGPSGEEPVDPTLPSDMGNTSGMGNAMGGSGGMAGGFGGASGQEPEFDLYDLEGSVLMTVTAQDSVTLTITVDEQDISKVSIGQIAEINVAALRGQTFEAEVTNVAASGTNSGGSSKFTVELTMEKSEDMLAGMSATASIPLYTKVDVLTIPVAALTENGATTMVYTALDEETGNPTAPVEVTVGISDGETAEILSGLGSGDSFYYSYYDTLELSEKVESVSFSFGRK